MDTMFTRARAKLRHGEAAARTRHRCATCATTLRVGCDRQTSGPTKFEPTLNSHATYTSPLPGSTAGYAPVCWQAAPRAIVAYGLDTAPGRHTGLRAVPPAGPVAPAAVPMSHAASSISPLAVAVVRP